MKKICAIILYLFFLLTLHPLPSAAEYDKGKTFKYLEEIFNLDEKKLYDFLIPELEIYLHLFPKSKDATQAQFMIGNIYEKKGNEHFAIAAYLKMLFLYPPPPENTKKVVPLYELIAKDSSIKGKKDWLLDHIEKNPAKKYSEDGYFSYIETLVELEHKKLVDLTIASCRDFLMTFPDYPRNDLVLKWIADLYRKGKHFKESDASYIKITEIYPKSNILPDVLFNHGTLRYQDFKDYEGTLEIMRKIASKYPRTSNAVDALMLSGEILEKKLKDYNGAISIYRDLVDRYPKDRKAVEALWEIASINKSKLKEAKSAIAAYNKIVTDYPDNKKGLDALEEIADLYKGKLKNYEAAAETYEKITILYPQYKHAPDRLMEAGSLYEGKLKDREKAVYYYNQLVEKFPQHGKAKSAAKRIAKLSAQKEK